MNKSFLYSFLTLILSLAVFSAHAERHALLIGNDSYETVTKLSNARADADAASAALHRAGFKVTLVKDRTFKQLKDDLRRFKNSVQGGDEVVIFYAGHGVQINAMNYLLPIDVRSESEDQVKDDSLPLYKVLEDIREKKPALTLAVIDACRDNPFKSAGRAIGGRGLTGVAGATGQMVIYSAGEGQRALDRLSERDPVKNGVFTRVFIKELEKPGVTVDQVARNVREEVNALALSIGHEQVPAIYDQVLGKFYFHAPSKASIQAVSSSNISQANSSRDSASFELAFWDSVKNSVSADDFKLYLDQYPQGQFASLARSRFSRFSLNASSPTETQAAPLLATAGNQVAGVPSKRDSQPVIASTSATPGLVSLDRQNSEAPVFSIGDKWTYAVIDGFTGKQAGTKILEISEVTREGIRYRNTPYQTDASAINTVISEAGIRHSPRPEIVKFPLQVGNVSTGEFETTEREGSPKLNRFKTVVQRKETVQLASGIFDTFYIEHDVEIVRGTFVVGCGTNNSTVQGNAYRFWYAPAVRRFVKYERIERCSSAKSALIERHELLTFETKK